MTLTTKSLDDLMFPAQKLCVELVSKQENILEADHLMWDTYKAVTEKVGSAKETICKCSQEKRPLSCHKYHVFMDAKWMLTYLEMQRYYSHV